MSTDPKKQDETKQDEIRDEELENVSGGDRPTAEIPPPVRPVGDRKDAD
jgi:hypothetical protein